MSVEANGHWYKRNGDSCHEVPKKDGSGMRGISLNWDRPLCLVPSVTTVLSILNKHQLNVWKENQMVLAALTLERLENEQDEDFLRRLRSDAFQQVKDAADIGTLVHDALEQHYLGKPYDLCYESYVTGVVNEVNKLFPEVTDWVAESGFAHNTGFGGRVDLHSPSTGIVVDFKSKDGDFSDKKKLHYDQHYQLAAYQIGLNLPKNKCANIFFSRTHPGAAVGVVWKLSDITDAKKVFTAALALWKAIKRYDPSF
jgi:hypothetical protein